jgi:hypothetical protein
MKFDFTYGAGPVWHYNPNIQENIRMAQDTKAQGTQPLQITLESGTVVVLRGLHEYITKHRASVSADGIDYPITEFESFVINMATIGAIGVKRSVITTATTKNNRNYLREKAELDGFRSALGAEKYLAQLDKLDAKYKLNGTGKRVEL